MHSPLKQLDRNRSLPLYEQIKQKIARCIEEGHWSAGSRIPSENELTEDLGVSRMTINRALRELTQEGELQRVHGLGTFVAEPPRHASLIQLKDIAEEVTGSGSRHSLQVITRRSIKASASRAEAMQLGKGAQVFEFVAIHYRDDLPIQFEHRFVNPALAPEFIENDFNQTTATQYLINLFKPDEMEHRVCAILPSKKIAKALRIDALEPCLRLSRRTWKDNQVVTMVDLVYPSSRYDLEQRYSTEQFQNNTAATRN